jgi:NRPS condensation-like uncharacterized protein
MRNKPEEPISSVPLNCVDECLLALDSINEPMLFWIVVDLQGEIDQARLKEAVASARQAHPVMKTIVRTRNFRLSREIREDSEKEVLSFADQTQLGNGDAESYLSSWMNQPLNPSKEFPMRVLLLKKNELQSSLIFMFHHSAADGLRGVLFARKVVESYNNGLSQDSESTADVRVNRKGDELLEFARSRRSEVKHYYRKIIASLFGRFVIAAFPPPTRVFHDKSGRSRELAFCLTTIGPEELMQVQSKARTVGVGLNDVFLAASYLAVEKWNTMHGKASDRIRVMVPVNISPADFRYPVSNHVSWLSFATTRKDRLDSVRLVRKARADTTDAINNGISFSLIYFFYVCSRFPLFLMREIARFLIVSRIYVDSILVTNVGFAWAKAGSREPAVSSMGDARVLNVSGSAPVVTPMGVSIAICTYDRNLNLSLTYRPALLSKEKAKMFLDLYVEEIRNYRIDGPGT